mmetsp:Transcript_14218/g.28648  ORF Transcript_14218/g.28648 Transcript_14218/m.28648 type:complete len:232 (-) Transcript_14218:103-798(-)
MRRTRSCGGLPTRASKAKHWSSKAARRSARKASSLCSRASRNCGSRRCGKKPEVCRWLTARSSRSLTKQRNSQASFRERHSRRTRQKRSGPGAPPSLSVQSSKLWQRSCATKSEDFKSVKTSCAFRHLSVPKTHFASLGALQLSLGSTSPPSSSIARLAASATSRRQAPSGAPASSPESEPPSPQPLLSLSGSSAWAGRWMPSVSRYFTKSSGNGMMMLGKVTSRKVSYHL